MREQNMPFYCWNGSGTLLVATGGNPTYLSTDAIVKYLPGTGKVCDITLQCAAVLDHLGVETSNLDILTRTRMWPFIY